MNVYSKICLKPCALNEYEWVTNELKTFCLKIDIKKKTFLFYGWNELWCS